MPDHTHRFTHSRYLLRRKVLTIAGAKFHIFDPYGEFVLFSTLKALVRRFTDAASMFMPQAYHAEVGGQTVATYKQNSNPFVQEIDVDFTGDPQSRLDPRPGLEAAVILCAIEGRQD